MLGADRALRNALSSIFFVECIIDWREYKDTTSTSSGLQRKRLICMSSFSQPRKKMHELLNYD